MSNSTQKNSWLNRLLFRVGLPVLVLSGVLNAPAVANAETNQSPKSTKSSTTQKEKPSGIGLDGKAGDDLNIKMKDADGKESVVAAPIKMFVVLTLLSIAPALLVMMTSFTRIVVVLGFIRQALSTQQIPPNIVLIGLAMFLTMFLMAPTFTKINQNSLEPYLDDKISHKEAIENAVGPLREFMGKQTRTEDLALFLRLSNSKAPRNFDDVPTSVLVPSFVMSELRRAFQMGFLIFLPFVIIDLVVASILMSLGMVMLPPAMIALPLKVLLFVLADGWNLVVKTLIFSFG